MSRKWPITHFLFAQPCYTSLQSHAGRDRIAFGNHWYNGYDAQGWWLDDHTLLQPTGEAENRVLHCQVTGALNGSCECGSGFVRVCLLSFSGGRTVASLVQ